MIPIRVRHPRGVITIEIDPETYTIQELQMILFSSTEITPEEQEIKFGYPPKPLPIVDGPLSSIPLTRGEQLIITSKPTSSLPRQNPTPGPSVKSINQSLSAPSPPPAKASTAIDSTLNSEEIPVETTDSVALPGRDAGYLQLRVVPDDNSCLFSAVAIVFEGGTQNAQALRKVIADTIRRDEDGYPDVILGQPRSDYIAKIQRPETWGGAIELSILSNHYKTEISSFDVATGRCDRFGQDQHESRCLLVYSGIHYDAITLSPLPVSPPSFHTTVFPVIDQTILPAAETLVAQLRARHYYTDTASFDLRCGVCKVGLKGEKGAREHAMQTGHVKFGEY